MKYFTCQRLNVLMTRAQALVILIGDAETLKTDENWRMVVNFFEKNNAIVTASDKAVQQIVSNLIKQLDKIQFSEIEL